jgi:hypothetical protein
MAYTALAFTIDSYFHIISGVQEEATDPLDGATPVGIVSENPALQLR